MRWCCRPQPWGCCFCFFLLSLSLQASSNEKQNQDHHAALCLWEALKEVQVSQRRQSNIGLGKVGKCTKQIHHFVCQNVWPWFWGLFFFFWTRSSLPHQPGHFLQDDGSRSPWQPNVAIISVTGSYIVHSSSCDSPRGRSSCLTAHGNVRQN